MIVESAVVQPVHPLYTAALLEVAKELLFGGLLFRLSDDSRLVASERTAASPFTILVGVMVVVMVLAVLLSTTTLLLLLVEVTFSAEAVGSLLTAVVGVVELADEDTSIPFA